VSSQYLLFQDLIHRQSSSLELHADETSVAHSEAAANVHSSAKKVLQRNQATCLHRTLACFYRWSFSQPGPQDPNAVHATRIPWLCIPGPTPNNGYLLFAVALMSHLVDISRLVDIRKH
jgi:hypothetical protein